MPKATHQFCTQYNNPTWDWNLVSTSLEASEIIYWARKNSLFKYRLTLRERPYLLILNDIVDYTKFTGSFLYILKPFPILRLDSNIRKSTTIACFPHPHERQMAYNYFKENVVAICNGTVKDYTENRKIGTIKKRVAAE